jgi:hypothetical protein
VLTPSSNFFCPAALSVSRTWTPHVIEIPKPPAINIDVSSATRWGQVSRHPVFLSVLSSDLKENNELRTNTGPYVCTWHFCVFIPK